MPQGPADDVLHLFTIYKHPKDYPGKYVVREFAPDVPALVDLAVVDTLGEARAAVPHGLVCLTRSPDDDPVIVETWL